MAHPYNKIYLSDAMENLADAFDTAASVYKFQLDYFLKLFIISGIAVQFEIGNPKYVSGKSGAELVADVVSKTNASKVIMPKPIYKEPTEEYWTGWVLAYYQWCTNKRFRDIQNIITMEELKSKYHPYHEMDEEKIVDYIDMKKDASATARRLQAYRKALGLSQSQLAKESGINLRTLQQYEIGAKELNKASASTVLALSKTLKCDIEDLI